MPRHNGTGQEEGLRARVDHEKCLEEEKRKGEPTNAGAHDNIRQKVLLHTRTEDWL